MAAKLSPTGVLYLLPTPLGESGPFNLSDFSREPFSELRHFICEDLRTARRYLRAAGFKASFEEVTLFEMGKHSEASEYPSYLQPAFEGKNIGLLSEAGMPCIADPGSALVAIAHQKGIKVVPIPGPSSIFLALAASGLNGQRFEFHGYLPLDGTELRKKIQQMARDSVQTGKTHIFIETPFRSDKLLDALRHDLNDTLQLCVAISLSQPGERIICCQIGKWKKKELRIGKEPAVFLIGL